MRTVRTICLISMAIVCLLAGARPAAARILDQVQAALSVSGIVREQTSGKVCDEVLYVAYGGREQYEYLFTKRVKYNKAVKFPHYVGAICVDAMNESMKFYPQDGEFPANPLVKAVVRAVLSDNFPRLHIGPVDKGINTGDGIDIGKFIGFYHLWSWPKDPMSLAERTEYALEYFGCKVIRHEANTEPDLKWAPKFKQTRYHHELEKGPQVYDWTE